MTPSLFRFTIAFVSVCVLASSASAQLVAERLYYGLGQRVPILVQTPDGFVGEITIRIHDPSTGTWPLSAPAAKGRVDLASLIPELWSDRSGQVRYAQLELDGVPTGAPLVLQPMVTPNRAQLVDEATMRQTEDPRGVVAFEDDRLPVLFANGEASSPEREATYSGLRVYQDREVVMRTTEGDIVFRLRPDAAPNTAFNFLHLVDGGFYTDVIFHRVVAALPDGRPFVIQVGDLSGTGSGGPGYMVDLENSSLEHRFGVLSMARDSDPDTNGSQVFIALSREGTSFLDGRYTAFAQAIDGAEVIRAIARVEVNNDDRPIDAPMIRSCESRAAPPIQDRRPSLGAINGRDEGVPQRAPEIDR